MSEFMADALAFLESPTASPVAEAAPQEAPTTDVLMEPVAEGEVLEPVAEESSDTEMVIEEDAEPEVEEIHPAVKEFEAHKIQAEKQTKALQKRIKAEGEAKRALEMQLQDLRSEGIDVARDVASLMKQKKFDKVFEKFGFSGDDVVEMYKGYLGGDEAAKTIKENMRQKELDAREAALNEEKRVSQRNALKTSAVGVINKFADKIPVFAALDAITGGSTVDQLLTDIGVMYQRRDPEIIGCQTFEEAVKKILPEKEKQARRQYKAILDAFSKVEASKNLKAVKSEVKPEEKKPEVKPVPAKPKVEAPVKKPVAKGSSSSVGASSSKAPQSRQDFIDDALRMLP